MEDRNTLAKVAADIKMFGSLLGLSEAECRQMAHGGSRGARRRCRDEMLARYFRENRPEPIDRRNERRRGVKPRELVGLEQLDFWQQAKVAKGFVYFIQQGDTGPVKIGLAKEPLRRMASLQTGNPAELHLRHVVPGVRSDEAKLHHRFRDARIRGEWFGLAYLDIVLIYGAGLASSHIRCFEESDSLAVMPDIWSEQCGDLDSERDRFEYRKEIERLWNQGFNAGEIAEFVYELDEADIKAELTEMRKDSYWQVGRKDGRPGVPCRESRAAA